jgi:hypothetical protein
MKSAFFPFLLVLALAAASAQAGWGSRKSKPLSTFLNDINIHKNYLTSIVANDWSRFASSSWSGFSKASVPKIIAAHISKVKQQNFAYSPLSLHQGAALFSRLLGMGVHRQSN